MTSQSIVTPEFTLVSKNCFSWLNNFRIKHLEQDKQLYLKHTSMK